MQREERIASLNHRYDTNLAVLVERRLLAEVPPLLSGGADRIERYGWWGCGQTEKIPPTGQCCIWLAPIRELDERCEKDWTVREAKVYLTEVINLHIVISLGCSNMHEVFSLNDKQSMYEGQSWATYQLRTMARIFEAKWGALIRAELNEN